MRARAAIPWACLLLVLICGTAAIAQDPALLLALIRQELEGYGLVDESGTPVGYPPATGVSLVLASQTSTSGSLSYVVPGGTLDADGETIKAFAMIYTGGGGSSDLSWNYGGSDIVNSDGLNAGEYAYTELTITYSGAASQECVATYPISTGGSYSSQSSDGMPLSKDNTADQTLYVQCVAGGEIRSFVVVKLVQ